MNKVIRYEANDGTLFVLPEHAVQRDLIQARIDEVLNKLPKHPNGNGYVQHKGSAVLACQELAVELSKIEYPGGPWDQAPPNQINVAYASRYLDSYMPVMRLWNRLSCIDKEFREWEQPYFVYNPDEATMVELQPK